MKKRSFILVLGLILLAIGFLATCNNPIMEKWWPGKDITQINNKTDTGGGGGNFGIVRFNTLGGSPQPQDLQIAWGSTVGRLRPLSRPGYGFGGWLDEFGNLWDVETTPVEKSDDKNGDGYITLTAYWSTDYRTVTFVPYSGDTSSITKENVANGARITQPVNPAPPAGAPGENLGFAGWYTVDGTSGNTWSQQYLWNFNNLVSDNITLYAKWDSDVYTVIFVTDGGTRPNGQSITTEQFVPKDGYIQDPGPLVKTNYSFSGWYADSGFTEPWSFATKLTSAHPDLDGKIYLYIKWQINEYLVSFLSYPTSVVPVLPTLTVFPADQSIPYGGKVTEPIDEPTQLGDGRGFTGWYTEETYLNKWDFENDTITGNMILYAKWEYQTRTVQFSVNGGTDLWRNTFTIPIASGIVIDPGAPMRDGYTYTGWYEEPSCDTHINFSTYRVTAPDIVVGMDMLYFYAGWTANTYTITFEPNGADQSPAAQSIDHGQKVNDPGTITKTGMDFIGWYSDPGFAANKKWDFNLDTVTSGMTLYARWDVAEYEVSFNIRNDYGPAGFPQPPVQHIIYSGQASEPFMPALDPADTTSYGFYRWDYSTNNTDNSATFKPYNFDTPVTANLVLYARWVPPVPDMAWAPRGEFILGDTGVSGSPAAYHSYPTHKITLDGFYMARTEVTQKQYETLMAGKIPNARPSNATQDSDDRPVERVSWFDAIYYCNELTNVNKTAYNLTPAYTITGITRATQSSPATTVPGSISNATVTTTWTASGYRLPTEAEWEYAAKGFDSPNYLMYAGSDDPTEVAWFTETVKTQTVKATQKVGSPMLANSLGIYNMSGNVSEWCWDWFAPYKDFNSLGIPSLNPRGPANPLASISAVPDPVQRVRRGGAWNNAAGNVRTPARNSEPPADANWVVGFRVARSPSEIW
ncbi:MAG: InlB B-repeat-containing protein [Treponema sp.]|nr:InlB B-repeat-containing protein [Treponema sp.]